MEDTLYWLWLSLALSPGCKNSTSIIDYFFCNAKSIYDEDDYSEITGKDKLISSRQAEALLSKSLDEAKRLLDFCDKNKVTPITPAMSEYPRLLLNTPSCPVVVYARGKMPDFESKISISCVGTRKMTRTGRRFGYEIAYDLAKSGIIITSGMALGIDSACHRAALDAGGTTLAIMGSGIDVVYPHQNFDLMREIIGSGGCVFTEYPPGTPPIAHNFPVRNRIVSAISVGTLVIEAGERSGSLNTARNAVEQGRDLFAVPGESGEFSHIGANLLLKQGAIPVTEASDIINFYTERYGSSISFNHITGRKSLENSSLPDIQGIRSQRKPTENKTDSIKAKREMPDFSSYGEDSGKIAALIYEKAMFPDEISLSLGLPVSAVLSSLFS